MTVEDVACRAAWKRREAEGTDMLSATVDVELAFMGPPQWMLNWPSWVRTNLVRSGVV